MPRTILHLDLDAFFCAVETLRDPSLAGKPFAVGGRPQQRGVVASCSYEARAFGVRSAMPMSQAVRLCKGLMIVPHHFDAYHSASREVMTRLQNITPLVEQISIDEAFLDVTGIRDAGRPLAVRLQSMIRDELGLPCSFGVATNKLIAKIANNTGKANTNPGRTPNAVTVVPPGEEAAFLAPLPIQELWGVGPKTAQQLDRLGLRTIGDLAKWSEHDLVRRFGKNGGDLWQRAQGIDNRPVETEHETKSISKETTYAHDVRDGEALLRTLRQLSEGVGRRLRQSELVGTTIKIKLRWSDFTTVSRQLTLHQAVDQDGEIYDAAVRLFHETWMKGKPVRLIGVAVTGLEGTTRQLGLWETEDTKQQRHFQSIVDDLRDRFGDQAIQRGTDLKHHDD